MIEGRPSQTAAFVSTWRALGDYLPPHLRLCTDPFGWVFSPPAIARLGPIADRFPRVTGRLLLASPLRRLLLWMQLRTRAIDDFAVDFARAGGRQIVILGAGYDSRALRLGMQLGCAQVFEVDHHATQGRKRSILAAQGVRSSVDYLPWDFERERLEDLPSALQNHGLSAGLLTLTIWEGVIPYLTEQTVKATFSAIRTYGGKGSPLLFHYIEKARVESRTVFHAMASRAGEPLRFGWAPDALAQWVAASGFHLENDQSDEELANNYFPLQSVDLLHGAGGRIAVARSV